MFLVLDNNTLNIEFASEKRTEAEQYCFEKNLEILEALEKIDLANYDCDCDKIPKDYVIYKVDMDNTCSELFSMRAEDGYEFSLRRSDILVKTANFSAKNL